MNIGMLEKNMDRNRRIYERKEHTGQNNESLGRLFGMSKSNIGYCIRAYKKYLETKE